MVMLVVVTDARSGSGDGDGNGGDDSGGDYKGIVVRQTSIKQPSLLLEESGCGLAAMFNSASPHTAHHSPPAAWAGPSWHCYAFPTLHGVRFPPRIQTLPRMYTHTHTHMTLRHATFPLFGPTFSRSVSSFVWKDMSVPNLLLSLRHVKCLSCTQVIHTLQTLWQSGRVKGSWCEAQL